MTSVVAGAASGLLMASVFVGAGVLMLFAAVKDPSPASRAILERLRPGRLVMSGVLLAYPVWGIVGVVMGLLYRISSEQAPGGGLGSPNQVFTLAVIAVAVALAGPFAVVLRRVLAGVLAIGVAFIGLFGWFLPYFAA